MTIEYVLCQLVTKCKEFDDCTILGQSCLDRLVKSWSDKSMWMSEISQMIRIMKLIHTVNFCLCGCHLSV